MGHETTVAGLALKYKSRFGGNEWFDNIQWDALKTDDDLNAAAMRLTAQLHNESNLRWTKGGKLAAHSFNSAVVSGIVLVLACITYLADQPYNPGSLMVIAGYLQLLSIMLQSRAKRHIESAHSMLEDASSLRARHNDAKSAHGEEAYSATA